MPLSADALHSAHIPVTSPSGVKAFASVTELPRSCAALFAPPGDGDFFATQGWYETVEAAGLPASVTPYYLLSHDERTLLPLQIDTEGRRVSSLTTPYTCLFTPLVRTGTDPADLRGAGRTFARALRGRGTIRLDALREGGPEISALVAGARAGGLFAAWFHHFGNWHEPIAATTSWESYLAARDGKLREIIRRRLKRAESGSEVQFKLIAGPADIEDGIAAYEDVYRRSWKEPEPFPLFNAALMRMAAAQGVLRLGLLFAAGEPVAVQFWVVSGGVASVLKLAHDESAKALSPGTVLTALMIRHLLTCGGVRELDFGRGDDPYKKLWTTQRRQRVGVVLANPLRTEGALFLARHIAGMAMRSVRG